MKTQVPISFVMTRDVQVVDVSAKLSVVRHALVAAQVHHMPIIEGDRLVGILSWRDLVRAYRAASGPEDSDPIEIDDLLDRSTSIAELMSTELVTVRDDDPLDAAIDAIADGRIHSVLVIDADGRLVGIVTDKNLVDYLAG